MFHFQLVLCGEEDQKLRSNLHSNVKFGDNAYLGQDSMFHQAQLHFQFWSLIFWVPSEQSYKR